VKKKQAKSRKPTAAMVISHIPFGLPASNGWYFKGNDYCPTFLRACNSVEVKVKGKIHPLTCQEVTEVGVELLLY